MESTTGRTTVKVVGANGQISLGKQFAGRQVLVEEKEPGVWLVRAAVVVPESEAWLYRPAARADLLEAIDWANRNPPRESDPDETLRRLEDGQRKRRKRKA
ncbi:MAG: hypothetical protein ACT4P3_05355 [Betaproteobacteria bacterium]